MQCVERAESESGERASPIGGRMARCDRDGSGFQPQPSGQSPVFTRNPLVLEIVSGRAYEMECPGLRHVEDCRYRLRLSSDSLDRCVIEWTLEAAEVEAGNLAHVVIVLPAPETAAWGRRFGSRAFRPLSSPASTASVTMPVSDCWPAR